MVHVRIELWPLGVKEKARLLGEVEIANDATGTAETGNYTFRLSKFLGKGTWKKGQITGFARQTRGPFDLLFRVLAAAGMDRRNAKRDGDAADEVWSAMSAMEGLEQTVPYVQGPLMVPSLPLSPKACDLRVKCLSAWACAQALGCAVPGPTALDWTEDQAREVVEFYLGLHLMEARDRQRFATECLPEVLRGSVVY